MNRVDIYKERNNLEEFGIDNNNTVSHALFNALFQIDYITTMEDAESELLSIFNDTYYICTLILLDKRPYFKYSSYEEIAFGDFPFYSKNRAITVLSMVSVYINSLDVITDDVSKTYNIIKKKCSGLDGEIYEKLTAIVKDNGPIVATTFLPYIFPKDEDLGTYWDSYKEFGTELARFFNNEYAKKDNNNTDADKRLLKVNSEASFEKQKLLEKITDLEKELEEKGNKNNTIQEYAFNAQTGGSCLTSTQMGILMEGVSLLTEEPVPGKTTLGEIVESISGYKATTVNQNLKGNHRAADKEAVAKAIESKLPNLAAKIRKL